MVHGVCWALPRTSARQLITAFSYSRYELSMTCLTYDVPASRVLVGSQSNP